jgi:hypothetical protein
VAFCRDLHLTQVTKWLALCCESSWDYSRSTMKKNFTQMLSKLAFQHPGWVHFCDCGIPIGLYWFTIKKLWCSYSTSSTMRQITFMNSTFLHELLKAHVPKICTYPLGFPSSLYTCQIMPHSVQCIYVQITDIKLLQFLYLFPKNLHWLCPKQHSWPDIKVWLGHWFDMRSPAGFPPEMNLRGIK